MIEEGLAQVRQVSVRMSLGRDTLIHLHDVDSIPRDRFPCQRSQHETRSLAAADCKHEVAPDGNRRARLLGDERGRPCRSPFGTSKQLDFHERYGVIEFRTASSILARP